MSLQCRGDLNKVGHLVTRVSFLSSRPPVSHCRWTLILRLDILWVSVKMEWFLQPSPRTCSLCATEVKIWYIKVPLFFCWLIWRFPESLLELSQFMFGVNCLEIIFIVDLNSRNTVNWFVIPIMNFMWPRTQSHFLSLSLLTLKTDTLIEMFSGHTKQILNVAFPV